MKKYILMVFSLSTIVLFSQDNAVMVTGGFPITIQEAPYQVSLFDKGKGEHNCGGVILNDRYVLTAVYCINPNLPKDYLVRV